jgi:beta-glucanase (GH16 family)
MEPVTTAGGARPRGGEWLALLGLAGLFACSHSPPAPPPPEAPAGLDGAVPGRRDSGPSGQAGAGGAIAADGATAASDGPAPPEPSPPADAAPAPVARDGGPGPGWRLVWSDEFDGAAGAAPDATRWKFDVGGGGWGNAELEYHTNRRENSALDGQGNLAITAQREDYMGRAYTSARLNTAGRFTHGPGRFEARIKLPTGRGIWPAFWALGANIAEVGWPACGEIDVMESVGSRPSENVGSLHGPGYSGGSSLTRSYRLPGGAAFPTDFHLFAVEWEASAIRFYVDGVLYQTRTPADVPAGGRWVFDHPFFIILNVAVGGRFPGNPDATTSFPQTMLVDYVRVYAR